MACSIEYTFQIDTFDQATGGDRANSEGVAERLNHWKIQQHIADQSLQPVGNTRSAGINLMPFPRRNATTLEKACIPADCRTP
jgi:hypothetical protein